MDHETPTNIQSFKRPSPPEPLKDPFPQKRNENKSLDDRINVKEIEHILHKVMQCLMTKSLHEGRKSDKFNQTQLGGVSFYIEHNEVTSQTRIMFDKHPQTWKENEIIKDILNIEGDIMMEKEAQNDMIENPFTY